MFLLNRTVPWYKFLNASFMKFSSKPHFQNTKTLIYHMALLSTENIFPIIFLLLTTFSISKAELHVHYYDQTCPQLEKIISETVLKASKHDPKVPARILRMFFHDCFRRPLLECTKRKERWKSIKGIWYYHLTCSKLQCEPTNSEFCQERFDS